MCLGVAVLIAFIMLWTLPMMLLKPSKFALLYSMTMIALYFAMLFIKIAHGSSPSLTRASIDSLYDSSSGAQNKKWHERINYAMAGNAAMMVAILISVFVIQSQLLCIALLLLQFSGVIMFLVRTFCGGSMVSRMFTRQITTSLLPI